MPPKRHVEPLAQGDTLDYSITASVKDGGSDLWIKVGATTTVRAGETTSRAKKRLYEFVEDEINMKVAEVVGRSK